VLEDQLFSTLRGVESKQYPLAVWDLLATVTVPGFEPLEIPIRQIKHSSLVDDKLFLPIGGSTYVMAPYNTKEPEEPKEMEEEEGEQEAKNE